VNICNCLFNCFGKARIMPEPPPTHAPPPMNNFLHLAIYRQGLSQPQSNCNISPQAAAPSVAVAPNNEASQRSTSSSIEGSESEEEELGGFALSGLSEIMDQDRCDTPVPQGRQSVLPLLDEPKVVGPPGTPSSRQDGS